MNDLADALLVMTSLAMTASEVVHIKELRAKLDPFDTKSISYRARTIRPSHGRLAVLKGSGGIASAEAMNR